jgi:LacI family transcriptional regulator
MEDEPLNRPSRVTMKDIARAAGVSQSTVSFVLNGAAEMRIGAETRDRVLAVTAELGYRPRSAGRPPALRAQRIVGVMVDEIATSPFAAISIEAMQERAWASGVMLEVIMTGGDRRYEAAILRKWAADRVEGVVYASILTREAVVPDALARHRTLLLNCYDPQARFTSIVPAERRGGEAATAALIEAGHERIAFISGEAWMEASRQRQVGFERALKCAGRVVDTALVAEGNFMPSGGRRATLELMSSAVPPDAIFCANDLMALGCYEALKELGLHVSRDVAVMGYDDQEVAQHLEPPLSTVLLPHREMGQMAIDRLLGDESGERDQVRLDCPLVLRGSHGGTSC